MRGAGNRLKRLLLFAHDAAPIAIRTVRKPAPCAARAVASLAFGDSHEPAERHEQDDDRQDNTEDASATLPEAGPNPGTINLDNRRTVRCRFRLGLRLLPHEGVAAVRQAGARSDISRLHSGQ